MAAQPYQIIGSEVIKDSQVPSEMRLYIVSFGKSTDTKPTSEEWVTGSVLIEVDTGKAYFYEEEADVWYQVGGGSDE